MSLIVTEVRNTTGVITLDRPKVNALSQELVDEIIDALAEMQRQNLRAVILRARPGVKVFSAGHEVAELPLNGRDPLTYNDPLRRLIRALQLHTSPVIAMVEGTVWGGACEMVMCCDLVVAADDTTFAITPAKLGVPYNISGVLNLMRVASLPLIKEMLFTARPIGAERLRESGVIGHVLPREEIEAFTFDLAAQIGDVSPLVVRILKEELRILSAARPIVPEAYERIQSLRREIYDSKDYQEGIRAFFERRVPAFQGK